jgi:hypothetical protein
MNIEDLNPPSTSVASLDALKAKLKERSKPDLASLKRVEHKGIGETFLIRPMNREGYQAVGAAEILPDIAREWPIPDRLKFLQNNGDRAYLLHGLYLEGGEKPDLEFVEGLMNGPWEADNRVLLHAIRDVNPPQDVLVQEYQATVSSTRFAFVFYRLAVQAGFLDKMRDWLLVDGETPEALAIAEDLRKWEETLPAFEALMEAPETANHFDIQAYNREPAE